MIAAWLVLAAAGVGLGAAEPVDMQKAGQKPLRYDEAVHKWLGDNLKDPESAKLEELRGPRAGVHFYPGPLFTTKHGPEAWFICYRVNAKNSYGGYTGWETYMFAFRGETLLGGQGTTGRRYEDKPVLEECSLPAA